MAHHGLPRQGEPRPVQRGAQGEVAVAMVPMVASHSQGPLPQVPTGVSTVRTPNAGITFYE